MRADKASLFDGDKKQLRDKVAMAIYAVTRGDNTAWENLPHHEQEERYEIADTVIPLFEDHINEAALMKHVRNEGVGVVTRNDSKSLAVRHMIDGAALNVVAAECHALAKARGKYPVGWSPEDGIKAITDETIELAGVTYLWHHTLKSKKPSKSMRSEFGDILHAVLSVGHHMGYDVAECLAGAMERNRERVGEGEVG